MNNRNDTHPVADSAGRTRAPSPGRVAAFLHTDLFSIGALVRRMRGDTLWWPDTITNSGLPPEVAEAVREIVVKTRLWNNERVEVARELCNHAAEALTAGAEANEVVSSLGETRIISRLIRRSMKRKRNWLWQTRMWCSRSLMGIAMAGLLVAMFITVRFFVGDPNVTRSFIAEMNAPMETHGDDERAWPLIRDAWATFDVKRAEASKRADARVNAFLQSSDDEPNDGTYEASQEDALKNGMDLAPNIAPSHPDFPLVMDFYRSVQPELAMVREAASKPIVGRLFSTKSTTPPNYSELDAANIPGWIGEPIPSPAEPSQQPLITEVRLPELGPMRIFARWLAFDARMRAQENDQAGAIASVSAMIGIVEQLDTEYFIIGSIVGMSIDTQVFQVVSELLAEHRDLFSDDQLIELAHRVSSPRLERVPLDGESMMFEDFLQRAFSDDGHGSGHLTNEGMQMLSGLMHKWNNKEENDLYELGSELVRVAATASRRELGLKHSQFFEQLRREEAAGYRIYRDDIFHSNQMVERIDPIRHYPLHALLPALGKAMSLNQERRVGLEACVTGIACELYRRETGAWPESTLDLFPRFMPFSPEDPFTGGSLKLAFRDGHAVVYAVGPDGDDDGGTSRGENKRRFKPRIGGQYEQYWDSVIQRHVEDPPDGDWVLFPSRY